MKGAPIIAPQVKPKAKSRLNRKNQHTGGPPHDRNQVGSQRRQQQPENEQVSGGGVGQADSFVGDAQQRWDDDNEFTAVDAGIDGATLLRNGGEDEEGGDKGSLARSILMGGNVQSFVDFFYLTHRPDPKAQQGQGEEGGKNEEVQGIDVGRREQVSCCCGYCCAKFAVAVAVAVAEFSTAGFLLAFFLTYKNAMK